jgi:hypothetical protein
MPETPDTDDLSYLNSDSSPEPEDEPAEAAPEPEEEPAAEEGEPEEEPAAEGEEEPEEEPAAARPQGNEEEPSPRRRQTANERVQASRKQVQEEREARIRAEAERDALLKFRQPASAQDNSEAIRLRKEKLDLMEPTERALFIQNERLEQVQQQLLISELRSQDSADKAAFEARAVVDPRYARYKEDVEKELTALRSRGINATREQALAQVLGRKLLSEKPRKGARAAAAQRVASTTGKPTSARSTPAAVAGKGDSLADIESRLRGKSFNSMFNN